MMTSCNVDLLSIKQPYPCGNQTFLGDVYLGEIDAPDSFFPVRRCYWIEAVYITTHGLLSVFVDKYRKTETRLSLPKFVLEDLIEGKEYKMQIPR